MSSTTKTIVALLAWYIFNGLFNVENKLILNQLHYPWIVSWVQLATGILVAVPVWMLGLRRTPIVDRSVMLKFAPMAALHAAGHALQVAGIGAGSVYFGTVIKATENGKWRCDFGEDNEEDMAEWEAHALRVEKNPTGGDHSADASGSEHSTDEVPLLAAADKEPSGSATHQPRSERDRKQAPPAWAPPMDARPKKRRRQRPKSTTGRAHAMNASRERRAAHTEG